MRHRAFLLAVFTLLLPWPAFAAEYIDYDYVDVALVSLDGPRDDFEGLGVAVSIPFNPQFYGTAEFAATTRDGDDRTDFAFGAGYRAPFNRRTDLIAEVDFLTVDTDFGEDDGLRLGAGLRSLVAKQLELRGMLRYVDLGDGELALELGAQYFVNDAWAGFLEVTEADDYGGYRIGARYNF